LRTEAPFGGRWRDIFCRVGTVTLKLPCSVHKINVDPPLNLLARRSRWDWAVPPLACHFSARLLNFPINGKTQCGFKCSLSSTTSLYNCAILIPDFYLAAPINMLWITLILTLLVIVSSWLYTVAITKTKFPRLRNKRICLLIAHPDDEAMFFAPTLLALTQPELGNHVKILCLSSGKELCRSYWARC
jgi:hypothetical protein